MASVKRAAVLVAVAAAAAAVLGAWHSGLFHRFEVEGVRINPRAAVRADREYTLVLWEETVPAPWAPQPYQQFVQDALVEFVERYPNVRVEVEWLDPATAPGRLAAALAAGHPPDVYGAAKAAWAWPLPWQVPASPYRTPEDEQAPVFLAAAEAGLTAGGALWGWPRGLWWEGWLAQRDALVQAGFLEAGDGAAWLREWRYDAVLAATGASPAAITVALDASDADVFLQLLHAFVPGAAADAAVPWTEADAARAADFVQRLLSSQAGGRDASALSRSRFVALAAGDVQVVAPVNPYSAQSALRRRPDHYVAVPPPAPPGLTPTLTVTPSAYLVFRRSAYLGDDHTRAAVELARFLAAKSEAWLVEAVGLLPASEASWEVWHQRSPWNDTTRRILSEASRAAAVAWPPADEAANLRAALQPLWQTFANGGASPEQFAASLRSLLERLREPSGSPPPAGAAPSPRADG